MFRLRFRTAGLTLAFTAALAVAACSDNTATTPSTTGATINETFTGSLTPNGGTTFSFVAQASGTITATLTTVSPDNKPIGLGMGTWNSSAQFCTMTVTNDRAVQGTSIAGAASLAGSYCVRVYDAAGTLTGPQSIQIDVVHP